MDRFLVPYFLDPTIVQKIERHTRNELRVALLAKVILKKMQRNFSRQTLAQLDKVCLDRGFSTQMQINEISSVAIRELFNREFNNTLDKEIIFQAWQYAYSLGLCPVDNFMGH